MNLVEHLKARTPMIWVGSEEPFRIANEVALLSSTAAIPRPVMHLHPSEGLRIWNHSLSRWTNALTMIGSEWRTVSNGGLAFERANKDKAILVIDNAEGIRGFGQFFGGVQSYLDMVASDDLSAARAQLIFTSFEPSPPAEISRVVAVVPMGLPNHEELVALTPTVVKSMANELATAGRGLSTVEFLSSINTSLARKQGVNPEDIAKAKTHKLNELDYLRIIRPQFKVDDIGGLDRAKALLAKLKRIQGVTAEEIGIKRIPRRFLFVGVPGTGKSMFVEAMASELGLDLVRSGIGQLQSKWVGESESNVRRFFDLCNAMAPVLINVEEFGREMAEANNDSDGGVTNRLQAAFLTSLQELHGDVYLLATANDISGLPPELTRADRFDGVFFIGFPTTDERKEILVGHLPTMEEAEIDELATKLDMWTGAELLRLVTQVNFDLYGEETPTVGHYLAAATTMKNRYWLRYHGHVIDMYKRAMDEFEWASSAQEERAQEILKLAKV